MLSEGAILQNRYQILQPIGKGGMGAVYLAKDQRLGNRVALKETLFKDEMLRRAFEREARLLAGLSHPALPRVMDHFEEGDGQFLVMEYIVGDDLETLFREQAGPFPIDLVLSWADQLLDALEYLHGQTPAVVHRDIKPQNLKLADRNRIFLLDFGLAKGQATDMTQTSGKSIFGYTAAYAPLEQIRGSGTDPRSDLYSLGATLYHLLTRSIPFDAVTRANSVVGHQPDPLRPAFELNPEISPSLAQVLQKATSLHTDQRFQTAAEFRRLLQISALTDTNDIVDTEITAQLLNEGFEEPIADVATTPIEPDFLNAETKILAISQKSNPDIDYTTKPINPSVTTKSAWRYTVGGVAAVSIMGAALWASANRPKLPTNNPEVIEPAAQIVPNTNSTTSPSPTPNLNNEFGKKPQNPESTSSRSEKKAAGLTTENSRPPQPASPPPPPASGTASRPLNTTTNGVESSSLTDPSETDNSGHEAQTKAEIENARRAGEMARRQVAKSKSEALKLRRRILLNMQRQNRRPPNPNSTP